MRLSFKRPRPKATAPRARAPEPPIDLPEYEPIDSDDPLAELEELMAANRTSPDPAVERRIVQLRHEAFVHLDRSATERPPAEDGGSTRDLPRPDGLPEVDVSDLDPTSIRDGILGGGSLVIRGLLDPDRAKRMRDGIDETFAKRDAFLQGADRSETTPWFDPFAPNPEYRFTIPWARMKLGGAALWAADSPRMMFELTDAFEQSGLNGLISEYLGERPALSMHKSVLRRASPDAGTDWHQDGAFLGHGIRTCNVWIALSRCGDVAPGLDIVSRRYDEIVETGTEGAMFEWAVSPAKVEESRDGAPVARPTFEPGDAVLFDHLCLHRTAVGEGMTEDRYATETWCFAPSVYPDETVPLVL